MNRGKQNAINTINRYLADYKADNIQYRKDGRAQAIIEYLLEFNLTPEDTNDPVTARAIIQRQGIKRMLPNFRAEQIQR